jgi:Mg-chelatase subunit ChlD
MVPKIRDDASLVIEGEGSQRGYIMFILDCSGTMRRNMGAKNRLNTAKDALALVLDELRNEEECWVGLAAYGHRAHFLTKPGSTTEPLLDDNGNPILNDQPPGTNVHPDVDVEEDLVPLSRLTRRHYDGFCDELDGLQAHGHTPLYLALNRALGMFPGAVFGASARHIVLVTDGVNFQSSYLSNAKYDELVIGSEKAPINRRNVQDRLDDLKAQGVGNVKIDMVFIDQQNAPIEELRDLRELSESTGGEVVDAKNTEDLVKSLRKALNLLQYSVTETPRERVEDEDRLDLRTKWRDRPFTPNAPGVRHVRIHRAQDEPDPRRVTFEGGEALRMQYNHRDNVLAFTDFANEERRREGSRWRDGTNEPVANPLNPREKFHVNALRPDVGREPDGNRYVVDFFIAIQNSDLRQFTPRPKHVWAEIQPLSESGRPVGRVFHCFDLDFAPDYPVPVLRLRAWDWPIRSAQKANISLWFKFQEEKQHEVPVEASEPGLEFMVPKLAGVAFEAQGRPLGATRYRLAVTERHEDRESAGRLASVRCVQYPDSVRHTYYYFDDGLTVEHEFEFDRALAKDLRILAREVLIQDAIHVPELKVNVEY